MSGLISNLSSEIVDLRKSLVSAEKYSIKSGQRLFLRNRKTKRMLFGNSSVEVDCSDHVRKNETSWEAHKNWPGVG